MNYNILFDGLRQEKSQHLAIGNSMQFYDYTNMYLTKNGKPIFPIVGEYHFSRYPHTLWEEELRKMKSGGITVVSTYLFWNFHEREYHVFDFNGDNNIKEFVAVCKKLDLAVILRLGPWAHGEVVRGGFPKWINKMPKKRSSDPEYMREVENYWRAVYPQVAEYLDGETVIGIQMENEYPGKISHLLDLRALAEKIGFKAPYFTMTAWPTNAPNEKFLPLFGGYADAPWNHTRKPLPPRGRFAIVKSRTDNVIGEDHNPVRQARDNAFEDYPYAGCEIGAGNQVSQSRRPYIGTRSACGVVFSKLAAGLSMIGYYMYHGGSNPNSDLYQESKRTGYPNNHQIIDYDFQAPLSRYGYARESYHYLRLLHTFINTFDEEFVVSQPFFMTERATSFDQDLLRASVRIKADFGGYLFVNNYERNMTMSAKKDVNFTVQGLEEKVTLPTLNVAENSMFCLPFNYQVGGVTFDYIVANPIAKVQKDKTIDLYFREIEDNQATLSVNGKQVVVTNRNSVGYVLANGETTINIIVLDDSKAKDFYLFGGEVCFSGAVLVEDKGIRAQVIDKAYVERGGVTQNYDIVDDSIVDKITLEQVDKRQLPHDYYLYSYGKKNYYRLNIDKSALENVEDIILEFDFDGSSLQVFADGVIIDDYFNINKKYVLPLAQYKRYILSGAEIIIKTAPQMRLGMARVYNEFDLPYSCANLALTCVKSVKSFDTNNRK